MVSYGIHSWYTGRQYIHMVALVIIARILHICMLQVPVPDKYRVQRKMDRF